MGLFKRFRTITTATAKAHEIAKMENESIRRVAFNSYKNTLANAVFVGKISLADYGKLVNYFDRCKEEINGTTIEERLSQWKAIEI